MTRRHHPIIALLVAMGGVLAATPPSRATSISPMNISDLVRNSSDIVAGTVAAVRPGTMGNIPYVEIELNVTDAVRGGAQRTLTFKRIGLQASAAPVDGRVAMGRVPGMTDFTVGEKVFLFLGPTSSRGFRAPVGLQQGKFTYGTGSVRNDRQNVGLFTNVNLTNKPLNEKEQAMVTTTQGALDSGTFVAFVRRAVVGNWWPKTVALPLPGPGPKAPGKKAGATGGVKTEIKGTANAD